MKRPNSLKPIIVEKETDKMESQLSDAELKFQEGIRKLKVESIPSQNINEAVKRSLKVKLSEPIFTIESWKYGEKEKAKREYFKGQSGEIIRGFRVYEKAKEFCNTNYGTSGVNKEVFITSEGEFLSFYNSFRAFFSGEVILNRELSKDQSLSEIEKEGILEDLNLSLKFWNKLCSEIEERFTSRNNAPPISFEAIVSEVISMKNKNKIG